MGLDARFAWLCEQEGPYPRNLPRLPEILGIAFEAAPYDSRVIESQALRKPDVLPPLLNRGGLPRQLCQRERAPLSISTRAVDGATRMGRKGGSCVRQTSAI
jgi:hypothetical protein